MISEKINRDNKREEKNMGKRKIIQITVLTTLVLTLSFASASNGRCKDKKWVYLQDNKKSG